MCINFLIPTCFRSIISLLDLKSNLLFSFPFQYLLYAVCALKYLRLVDFI